MKDFQRLLRRQHCSQDEDCTPAENINIDYTVQNTKADYAPVFKASLNLETSAKPFIEIMKDAAKIDDTFR